MKKQTFVTGVTFFFIILFTYAAAMKLLTFEQFRAQIGLSPPLSPYRNFLAVLVPGVECMAIAALRFPRSRLWGLYASYFLMVMFSAYIIIILGFSSYVPCSCGGILENMGWGQHLVFNVGCVVLAAAAVLFSEPRPVKRQPEKQTTQRLHD